MTTTLEQTKRPPFVFDGHLSCNFCEARYDYTLVWDSKLTARQQLRQAAERAGWKHTVADLDVCPEDAAGAARILIERFLLVWGSEAGVAPEQDRPPVMHGDDVQTTTIPAVVEPEAPVYSRPYDDTPKGSAA